MVSWQLCSRVLGLEVAQFLLSQHSFRPGQLPVSLRAGQLHDPGESVHCWATSPCILLLRLQPGFWKGLSCHQRLLPPA